MLKNLIESIKSKPKNKFSLENLHYLHGVLVRNPVINEQNKNLIIETLRQTAEVMIWGDQHNSEFFDFFLEKNILSFFLRILSQKTNRQVKVQLIQTLSILIENIRSQDSLYYILSNNHVNELITHKFDFSDDELMAYYISLLKTLSLKLNPNTVQFFFNSLENDFPLYTEAIKFFNHKDSMIRIAVRTLSLNVYKVEDEAMRRFVLDKTAAPYFLNIVWFIRDQCTTLDSLVANSTHTNRAKLEDFTAELMDYLYYLHDIFNLGIKELSEVLSDHLIKFLLLPQFVGSLIQDDDGVVLEDRLSPLLAVFLLAQVFYVFNYKPLINTIAAALFHPNPPSYALPHLQNPISLLETRRMPSKRYSLSDLQKLEAEQLKARKENEAKKNNTAPNTPIANRKEDCPTLNTKTKTNKYHAAILSFLNNGDRMILVVTCLFYAITKNQSIDPIMLEFSGLFPFRSYKAKQLLEELTEAKQKSTSENSKHVRSRSLNGIEKVTLSSSWVDNHPLSPEDLSFTSDQVSSKNRPKRNKEEIEVRFVETQLEHSKIQDDCQYYVTRVTKDFDISQEEAISLWNKFMGPLLQEETIENQNESLQNEDTVSSPQEETKSENVIIPPLTLPTNMVSSSGGDASLQESPRRKRATSEGSHSPKQLGVLHCKSEKEVTMAKLVEHLLRVLLQSNQCRLISLQMTTLLIKELVYSLDSEPNLTLVHFHIIEEAYKNTTNNLRACLSGSLGDIFLELFEHELRTFKQINFDSLIGDASSLLLPVSATPMSGIALSKRLPSGEAEKIQKAVQAFLVLRELKYTMLKQKDDRLPFREDPIPTLKAKDVYTFPTDSKSVIPSIMTVGPTKKKLQRYLILDSGVILIVEPDPRSTTKGSTRSPQTSSSSPSSTTSTVLPVSGHVCNTIPLQNIEMEVDKSDDSVLQLTSHPTTSRFVFDFESSVVCQSAKQRLEKARNKVRANKMMQIDEMLKDSVPFPPKL